MTWPLWRTGDPKRVQSWTARGSRESAAYVPPPRQRDDWPVIVAGRSDDVNPWRHCAVAWQRRRKSQYEHTVEKSSRVHEPGDVGDACPGRSELNYPLLSRYSPRSLPLYRIHPPSTLSISPPRGPVCNSVSVCIFLCLLPEPFFRPAARKPPGVGRDVTG